MRRWQASAGYRPSQRPDLASVPDFINLASRFQRQISARAVDAEAKWLAAQADAVQDGDGPGGGGQRRKSPGRHVVGAIQPDFVERDRDETRLATAPALEDAVGDDPLPGLGRIGADGLFGQLPRP